MNDLERHIDGLEGMRGIALAIVIAAVVWIAIFAWVLA